MYSYTYTAIMYSDTSLSLSFRACLKCCLSSGRVIRTNIQRHEGDKTGWNLQLPKPAPVSQYRPGVPPLLHDAFFPPERQRGFGHTACRGSLSAAHADFWKFYIGSEETEKVVLSNQPV